MKRLLIYALACLGMLLLAVSCSQAEVTEPGAGEDTGTLTLRITGTRTDESAYNPFDHLAVRIYDGQGLLVRKYTSQASIPTALQLLSGSYRITVEAGDRSAATFTNKSYYGEKAFAITPGTTQNVEVACKLINTAAQVKFDAGITQNFGTEFKALVCASNAYDAGAVAGGTVPTLEYTADKTGYFILPEGVENLSWCFRGTHPKHGEIIKTGVIQNVEPGYRYTVALRYSPDLPGYIGLALTVDTSTDDWDDTIIFSPDPTIKGSDFDMEEIQKYVSGEKSFNIAALGALQTVELNLDGRTYDLLNPTEAGIASERTDDFNLTVTLSDELFIGKPGGNNKLTFRIQDVDGGTLTTDATFRLQGLLPVSQGDQNLWDNTVTVSALVFNENISTVSFALRKSGGEWVEVEGVRTGDPELFMATFAPTWEESTNAAGLTVYTPAPGTGVFAANSYEYSVSFDQQNAGSSSFTTSGKQIIEGGNMEDGSMNCFNNNHGSFWDSGNNSMSDPLCAQSTKAGMEGAHCAKLAASKPIALVNLAAGNLFTGSFNQSGTSGTVYFGQAYSWQARPKALSVRYHAALGNVNQNQHGGPLSNGTPDKARIFVAIVDWSGTHSVTSGSKAPSGIWDPATMNQVNEGAIIAYGSLFIEGSTSGSSMIPVELPLFYYDKNSKPSGKCTLVISCATSAYGDYMNGCTSNVMYVDDFQWVY